MKRYELDHAKDGDTRYFIIHGEVPKGINTNFGYPICDSMNRHHCISPEEDEANGKRILAALNISTEIQEIMRVYREQEKSDSGVDTPGGLEHMGDVWRLLKKWDAAIS